MPFTVGFGLPVTVRDSNKRAWYASIPKAFLQAASANQLTVMINKLNQSIVPVGEYSTKQVHPVVDTNNSFSTRFVVAFPGAILDKDTGWYGKRCTMPPLAGCGKTLFECTR